MNRQYKICIVSHAHLTNNPRVLKEAVSLSDAGYNVSVITILVDEALYRIDMELISKKRINYSYSINLIKGQANNFRIFSSKFIRKFCEVISRYLKIDLPCQLSYDLKKILSLAKKENASLYICHNEPALWVGKKLAEAGKNVAFDFEDWYSQDYLVRGRPVRLLRELEEAAMTLGKYVTTTSRSMAEALHQEYNSVKPKIIYNAFSNKEREGVNINMKGQNKYPSLYWFSQTIGPGRGLEQIIKALNLINNNISLHLRGNVTDEFMKSLQSLLNEKHELIFHEPVPPSKLVETMQLFDIGLSLELNYPPSRNLTVTNKILHYLLAGLPVLASDTSGHKEIKELSDGAVEIIDLNDTEGTAAVINSLIQNQSRLKLMSEKALKASTELFNWEKQEQILFSCVEKVLN